MTVLEPATEDVEISLTGIVSTEELPWTKVDKAKSTLGTLLDAGIVASAARSNEASACTRRDVEPPLDAFVCDGVLDRQLCQFLVTTSEDMGYSFWHPDGNATNFRCADTVEVTHQSLADTIWQRVREHVVAEVQMTEDDDRCERGMDGTWRATSINHDLLFVRYKPGGHFSPHTDGYTIWDFNRRSFYSCLLYLNTCGGGGATRMLKCNEDDAEFVTDHGGRFRWPETTLVRSVPAVEGSALIFAQNLPHEGEPVLPGNMKYIIRTDVMYERVDKRCDTPEGREAYRLFREAELVEADGDCQRAARLYAKCMRTSPELAKELGL